MSALPSFSLIARGVSVERGDRTVLADVDLTLSERSRVAVVGPNGVGKSTLLAVLAGQLLPNAGSVEAAPPDLAVGMLSQELDRSSQPTVRALIAARVGVMAADAEFEAAAQAIADGDPGAGDRYDAALAAWLHLGADDFEAGVEAIADEIGLSRQLLDADPATLSGGEAGRVGLASMMLSNFDLTFLDEPTNDLDAAGLELLERWVQRHPGGLVIVSHDRAFLERTVTSVLEIDEHDHTATLYRGGWQSFNEERDRARALAQTRHGEYTTERDRLAGRAQQQREWATQGAARAKKSPRDGDKFIRAHNIAQTEKLVGKAKATQRQMERLEVVDKPWEGWDLRFTIDEAPRSGAVVGAFDKAVLERGARRFGPIDLEIGWGERLELAGPNGSGKTTLIDALLGRLAPSSGSVTLGRSVVVGELGQRRSGMDGNSGETLLEAFQELADLPVSDARSVLAKFGLDADAVERPAGSLSPGERTRAELALFQVRGVNLLVLDEPTNHLDMAAIEQLESALDGYTGTLLIVTHDRRLRENVDLTRTVRL